MTHATNFCRKISIVVPCYNEEKGVQAFYNEIIRVAEMLPETVFEVLFVNDGSKDNTLLELRRLAAEDSRVRYVSFSRNFGKEAAIFAGLENVTGDCCVIIDADLQHPPVKIIDMYHKWEEGYEVVEGIKEDRGDESKLHKFAANSFYSLISKAIGMDMAASSDYKLLDRKVVDALNSLQERKVFFRALSFWVGYKKTEVFYKVEERTIGESKWSTWSLVKYALTNITSFSSAPMQIVTILGVIQLIVSLVLAIVALVQKIMGVALGGFTTMIILLVFIGGIITISLGIIGYYIARIYDEIKGRPRYIISERK